jgi:hypothetical protein
MSCPKPRTGPGSDKERQADPSVDVGSGSEPTQPNPGHVEFDGQVDNARAEDIARLVDSFPPLSPAQRDRLASIFANRRRSS